MNQLETLKETIEYYGEDPVGRRGIRREDLGYFDETGKQQNKITSSCQYVVRNGEEKYCAVGRCLKQELLDWAHDVAGSVEDLISEYWNGWMGNESDTDDECYRDTSDESLLTDMMQPEYQGFPRSFWSNLQELHDCDTAWSTQDGSWLTQVGRDHVKSVLTGIWWDLPSDEKEQTTESDFVDGFLAELENNGRIYREAS